MLYDEIYRQYKDRILSYCKTLLNGNIHNAEDCTQQVFLKLYEKRNKLDLSEDIGAWLFKTAFNTVMNYKKKYINRPLVDIDKVEFNIPSDDDIEAEYEYKEKAAQLTEEEQQLIKDYYTGKEPEKRLGKTKNALKIQVHRLLKKIKM